jgi:hypothetical protein
MFTRITFRRLSRNLSFLLIGSLALSATGATYPQNTIRKAYDSAKGAVFSGASKLAASATSRIKGGLSSAFNSVKQLDRTVVIDRLQKQVESLGQKVGYMGNCIAKGTCSQAERAAFIGTSVTVLALTVAVVGVTLSVAATSKEVESITKVTSQEVQGWGPQQVFQRLGNTVRDFKQSLTSLKQGMLKRQLTRGQKKFLYGTAISITALVTIAVGAGVASYVYAEKKESDRKAETAAEEARTAQAEKAARANREMMETEELARQGTLNQEAIKQKIDTLLAEIGDFDDNPMSAQEKQTQSLFKRYFLAKIDVIKGGPQHLRQAFDHVKEQIRTGAIKTKEGALDAYNKAVNFAQNLPNILENALGVSLSKMNEGYTAINTAFEGFKTALSDPQQLLGGANPYPRGETFFSSVKSLGSYLSMIDQMSDDAEDAQEELSLRRMIHAKSITPEEYMQKKQKFAQKEAKIMQRKQELQDQVRALAQAQGLSTSKVRSKQADLEKESQKLAAKGVKLKKDRQILAHKESFDRFASPKYWSEQYFPEIMKRINALQLKNAGRVLEVLMAAFGKVFEAAEFLNKHGGAIGNRLFNTKRVGHGLRALNEELPVLGRNVRELLTVTPIILVDKLSPRQIGEAALKAMVQKKAKLLRDHKTKLQHIVNALQAIKGRYDPLHQKLRTLNKWFTNFKALATEEIKTALFKEKAIKRAAQITRDAVINIVEKQKIALNEVLTELPFITDKLTEILPDIGTVFVDLNSALKSIIGMEAINPAFLQKLAPILNARIPNIHKAIDDIIEGSKNYAAPAA